MQSNLTFEKVKLENVWHFRSFTHSKTINQFIKLVKLVNFLILSIVELIVSALIKVL